MLSELLKGLKRSSKYDDIPGMRENLLNEPCPACGRALYKYRPCCGAQYGYKGCRCGYKINLTSDSM